MHVSEPSYRKQRKVSRSQPNAVAQPQETKLQRREDTAPVGLSTDAMGMPDHDHHLQEEVDALLVRSAQSRRKLTRISEELNEIWRRARARAPRKRK